MKDLWYRGRIETGILQGVDWSEVRCHCIARAIVDFTKAGIAYGSISPVVFDPRFFPWPFDEKQSKLSPSDLRRLALWIFKLWPDWSLEKIHLTKQVTWLEVLSIKDQQRTLEILREKYGL